jgi:hypothetical protein
MSLSGIRKKCILILLLAGPYLFASVASDLFHRHEDPHSLRDPNCPACIWQQVVQDTAGDSGTICLVPEPVPLLTPVLVVESQLLAQIRLPSIRVPRAPPSPV